MCFRWAGEGLGEASAQIALPQPPPTPRIALGHVSSGQETKAARAPGEALGLLLIEAETFTKICMIQYFDLLERASQASEVIDILPKSGERQSMPKRMMNPLIIKPQESEREWKECKSNFLVQYQQQQQEPSPQVVPTLSVCGGSKA
uniref:Uncharacterized protein n=1 Tax=Myotis myotis TaxID=51298 RepID=A0A7J7WHY9_MYOMY|nr:hypothetical protein mMyoMyo1_012181 [Myotis myotis]